jgi:hypothetical protein
LPDESEVAMLTSDPHHALALAREQSRRLREEAASEQLRCRQWTRRAFAASLRRAANRLDPSPLAHYPA